MLALPSGPSATSGVDLGNLTNANVNTQNNQGAVRESATNQDTGVVPK